MKSIVLLIALFTSFSSFACMPNTDFIKHKVLMAAIDATAKAKYVYVQDLQSSDISKLQFAWVKTDPSYMCHDREIAEVNLAYSGRFFIVKLQMDNGKLTKSEVIEIAQ